MANRKKNSSTKGLREFMRDVAPVWRKQCVRCTTVYSKFHKLCPECEYGEWLLEGEVDDTGLQPGGRKQRPQYKPRPDTIKSECRKIQAGWERDGDLRATQGPVDWSVPRSVIKDTNIDLD